MTHLVTDNSGLIKENTAPELKELNVMGDTYKTRFTKKFENRKEWVKPDDKKLFSYIPGTVCKLFVKAGDKVEVGAKLLLLEAMKMQNVVLSPLTGIIKSVYVKEGEKIGKSILMVEFE